MSGFSRSCDGQALSSNSCLLQVAASAPGPSPNISGACLVLLAAWMYRGAPSVSGSSDSVHRGSGLLSFGQTTACSGDLGAATHVGAFLSPRLTLPNPSLLLPGTTSQINYTPKSVAQPLLSRAPEQHLCLSCPRSAPNVTSDTLLYFLMSVSPEDPGWTASGGSGSRSFPRTGVVSAYCTAWKIVSYSMYF